VSVFLWFVCVGFVVQLTEWSKRMVPVASQAAEAVITSFCNDLIYFLFLKLTLFVLYLYVYLVSIPSDQRNLNALYNFYDIFYMLVLNFVFVILFISLSCVYLFIIYLFIC
jgi:hypothetical protein